jgi:hypothetical protein
MFSESEITLAFILGQNTIKTLDTLDINPEQLKEILKNNNLYIGGEEIHFIDHMNLRKRIIAVIFSLKLQKN